MPQAASLASGPAACVAESIPILTRASSGTQFLAPETRPSGLVPCFWCNQAESGGAIAKKPRQLIECQRVPTPGFTKTDSAVYISLKIWDFLVSGNSDLHQTWTRTI